MLTYEITYLLKGIINIPFEGHYSSIIFNPCGYNILESFKPNLIYNLYGFKNYGKIMEINNLENWRDLGLSYFAIYKKK